MSVFSENSTDDISVIDLFKIILGKKVPILIITFFVTFLGYLYTKNIEDIYQSSTTLAPAEETNTDQSIGMLSGVASIAGINIPSGSSTNNVFKPFLAAVFAAIIPDIPPPITKTSQCTYLCS